MCVVSLVMDHYQEKWDNKWFTNQPPYPLPAQPFTVQTITPAEVEEFRKLLERAREYDRKHGEPDCELAEKKEALRKLADLLGVKIDFL